MNTLDTILSRRSIRKYKDVPVTDEDMHSILRAGMSGPSCVNARDWSFIVVKDRSILNAMADANGRPAEPLRGAAFAVLVCGDLERAFSRAPEYWVIDCSIACQNMILAAESLGIGSVWLGTWPQMNRVKAQAELFRLPETQVPHSLIAFGYADESPEVKPDYEADRVHFDKW